MTKTSQKRELFANALKAGSLRVFAAVLVIMCVMLSSTAIPSVGRFLNDSPQRVSAATASTINFQARLQNAAGSIAPDGSYNVEFKLYSASTGGAALWTEDYLNSASQGVPVKNGYLTVNLGSITALPTTINYDQDLWLTMTVRGTGSCAFASCTPADAEMSPRLKLTASAYAFKAGQLAQFNSTTGFTSTLQLLQPTGGNQTFQVADQGAAGTYNLLTQNQANTSYIQNQNASAQTTSNFWVSGTGRADTFNATTALQTGGTTRIDASGNLTNIGNISGTGNLQLSGTTGSSYIMSVLGLGTTNPQAGSALTVANGQWLSAIDSAGTGYVNMFQVNSSNEIQVGAALNVDGSIVLPTNGGQMTFSDLPIDSSVTAGTAESYTLRVGSSNALTIYGEADGSGNAQNVRVAIGSSIAPAYTLDVGGDVNTSGAYRISGTSGGTTTCSSGNVLSNIVVQGGIVTGGTCAANGGGVAPTLQDAYNNSAATNPQIQLSSGNGGLKIRDASTTVGNIFQIQNSAGSSTYFAVTASGASVTGTLGAGALQSNTLDTATATGLTIGGTNATSVTLGQSTVDTTVAGNLTVNRQLIATGSNNGGNTTGTLNNYGIRVQSNTASAGTGGTVNNYGAYINVPGGSGGTTNNYGVYIQGNGAGTLSYALYSASTAASSLAGTLDVSGYIGTTTGYKFNGTAGATTTCSSGNVLSNMVIQGGIVTGGTCAANGGGVAPTLQDAYNNSAAINPQIQLSTGNGGLKIRDASSTVGNIFQVQNSGGTATYFAVTVNGLQAASLDTVSAGTLTIGGTNATAITLADNVTVSAGQYISLVGGITSTRPASPTEGMLYYDTTTKQLIVYANGKWTSYAGGTATKIVAMGATTGCTGSVPVASANPEGADYVSTSCTSAQTAINSAITALPAGGGVVYLMEGTYIIDGSISLPSNVTLTGAGPGTVIKLKNAVNADFNMITNSDTTNGNSRIVVQQLKIDGNSTNNTAGLQYGMWFSKVATSTGGPGLTISNNIVENTRTGAITINQAFNFIISDNQLYQNSQGIELSSATNGTVNGNTISNATQTGILVNGTNFSVTNNTIRAARNGVKGNGLSTGILVSDNNISNSTDEGILTSNIQYSNITNNIVTNSGTSLTSASGISVSSTATKNVITGNNITDTGGTGFAILIASTAVSNYIADNTYSGTGAASISDTSTTTTYAGQQDSNGYFGFKASTTRLGIGNISPSYALDVTGDINSTTGFRFNGTAGSTTTCSGGNVLTNAVVQGGIITGGTCAANGGGVAPTLQNVYDNSGASPVINLGATGGGIKIQDASTTVGGSLFSVQNSTGSTKYLSVTTSGIDVAGNITFSGGATTISSAAGHALTVDSGTTGQLNLGTTASAKTVQIGTTTGAVAQTINIGNNTTASSVSTVVLGSTVGASSTTIQAGSAGISLTGALSGSSTINAVTGFKFNGTAGSTTTCTGGNVLSNIVVQGGIVTGGTCATNGGGVSPTLQNVYDNSTSPATILLTDGKNFVINAADTTTDPNILFNLQCVTSCGSNGRFAVQNAGTDVFAINPNGTIVVGSGGNTITLSSTGIVLAGNARNAKTIRLSAEYPSAVLDTGGLSSVTGTMTSGYDMTNRTNFYKWTTTQSSAQTYDIVTQVPIPSDWAAWNGSVISFAVATSSTTDTSAKVEVIDSGNTAATGCNLTTPTIITPASAPAWATNSTSCSISGGTYTAGDYLTIRIRLSAANGANIRVGNITLNYLSNK